MIRTVCLLALAVATLGKTTIIKIKCSRFITYEITALPQKVEKVVGDHKIVNGTDAPQGKYPSQVK